MSNLLINCVESLKNFIQERIKWESLNGPVRNDYFELLELSLLFLGGQLTSHKKKDVISGAVVPKEGNIFHNPGADSHARWMAKALYGLKIYLFREQFFLTEAQKKGLGEFCVFVVRFYVKAWFRSPMGVCAGMGDLQFIKDLIDFAKFDKKLVNAIVHKFSGHLWYLSEENIAMSFFDKEISVADRRKMVANLCLQEVESYSSSSESDTGFEFRPVSKQLPDDSDRSFEMLVDSDSESGDESDTEDEESRNPEARFSLCERRVKMKTEEIIKTFKQKNISEFVTKKTYQFFRRFDINAEFLKVDPQRWHENEHWISGRNFVKELHVFNDTAERAVKLMSDFLNVLTWDPEQTEYLFQVVSKNRAEFPSVNLKDLIQKK